MFNTIIFKIGNVWIGYYELTYLFGFITALIVLLLASHKKEIKLTKKQVIVSCSLAVILMLISAKEFNLFFWGFHKIIYDPLVLLRIYGPGWSFHGGLFGALVAGILIAKIFKEKFYRLADIIVLPVLFFLALGRLVNFINQDIIGTITDVPWCINYYNLEGCRHPVTLYAAIGRFGLFFYLYAIKNFKNFKEGFLFWNFIFFIGIGRFLFDFWRAGVTHFGLLAGQWFAIFMIILSAGVLFRNYREDISKVWIR